MRLQVPVPVTSVACCLKDKWLFPKRSNVRWNTHSSTSGTVGQVFNSFGLLMLAKLAWQVFSWVAAARLLQVTSMTKDFLNRFPPFRELQQHHTQKSEYAVPNGPNGLVAP